jgi:hypothetical protein
MGWALWDLYLEGKCNGKADLANHGSICIKAWYDNVFEHGLTPEEYVLTGGLINVPRHLEKLGGIGDFTERYPAGRDGMMGWVYRSYWMVQRVLEIDGIGVNGELLSGVVVEMPYVHAGRIGNVASRSGAILKLGFFVALVTQAFRGVGVPVELVTPRFWKGQAPKTVTQKRVYQVWGVGEGYPDDEIDAIGIGDWFVRIKCGFVPTHPIYRWHTPS